MEENKNVEVPAQFKSLVEQIEKMSVMELADLVKVLEEKFGVSAAAPVAVAGAAGAAPAEETKSNFDIELTDAGANKIGMIKAVKQLTNLGLKEAKDLVDGAPSIILKAIPKEDADKAKAAIEEAGGKATLK